MIYKFKNHEIELFDSTQKLTIVRFQRFNKYQMIACNVGSDFSDYDRRMEKALAFLAKSMVPEAMQELKNMRQTVFNAYNEFTPAGKSFAVMVKRIDSVNYEEYTPDDLDRIIVHLNRIGFDIDNVSTALQAVKKKIETELFVYFPESFPKGGDKEESALRFNRCNIMLDKIIENKESLDKHLYDVEKEILEQDKPNIWNVWEDNNMERILEVDFRKYGLTIAQMSGQVLHDMTVFDFYTTVELLKEKHKK